MCGGAARAAVIQVRATATARQHRLRIGLMIRCMKGYFRNDGSLKASLRRRSIGATPWTWRAVLFAEGDDVFAVAKVEAVCLNGGTARGGEFYAVVSGLLVTSGLG